VIIINIISVAIVTVNYYYYYYYLVMLLVLLILLFWLSNIIANVGLLFCSGVCNIPLPLISIHVLFLDPTHLEFKPIPIGDTIPSTLFGSQPSTQWYTRYPYPFIH